MSPVILDISRGLDESANSERPDQDMYKDLNIFSYEGKYFKDGFKCIFSYEGPPEHEICGMAWLYLIGYAVSLAMIQVCLTTVS